MSSVVQGLWIGERLQTMERLSIASFLANGHEYHLYTYQEVADVPAGVQVRDANAIVPASAIFQYREYASYAGFANFFRYKLLLERGGWWADMDAICLRPFVANQEYVFSSERDAQGRQFVNNGVLHAPAGAEILQQAWDICQAKDPAALQWGETGPTLLQSLVHKLHLWEHIEDAETFCPIPPHRFLDVVLPGRPVVFGEETKSVHLWNEMWRRYDLPKDEAYAPLSLYEQLKQQYLVGSGGSCIAHQGR